MAEATVAPEPVEAERVLRALEIADPASFVEPGVTAGDALAVMTVPPTPVGCVHTPDQQFGTAGSGGRALTMHLYAAADPTERRPGVVFIHGGGFQEGFPEMAIRYANNLAGLGFVTASIRYRLSPEAPFPACLEDAKCAVRWLRANASSIGLDADRVAVAGGSAGGTLAALVASTPGRFEGDGGNPDTSSAVTCAVLWYPAVDLRPHASSEGARDVTAKLFWADNVTAENGALVSPASYVAGARPTLTFTGSDDPIVPVAQVVDYHRALNAAGTANRLVIVDRAGHSFDFALDRWQECFDDMVAFLKVQLAPTRD